MGLTFESNGSSLVWVSSKQTPHQLLDTLIHESVHIYQSFVSYIQETEIGDEFQAYTIAYIASSLIQECKKQETASALHEES